MTRHVSKNTRGPSAWTQKSSWGSGSQHLSIKPDDFNRAEQIGVHGAWARIWRVPGKSGTRGFRDLPVPGGVKWGSIPWTLGRGADGHAILGGGPITVEKIVVRPTDWLINSPSSSSSSLQRFNGPYPVFPLFSRWLRTKRTNSGSSSQPAKSELPGF